MYLVQQLGIRRVDDAIAAVEFIRARLSTPVSIDAMHAALAAHAVGMVHRQCPPNIQGTNEAWSMMIHREHLRQLCAGTAVSADEIVAQMCARVAAYTDELLAFRAQHHERYLQLLRGGSPWFISGDNVQGSIELRRRRLFADKVPRAHMHLTPLRLAVSRLLTDGPSPRARDEFRTLQAIGVCDALERVSDAIDDSPLLSKLLKDILVPACIFEYHPVGVALEDALDLLRSVADGDEFDALVECALRKRRRSVEEHRRAVRPRVDTPDS
jgi:hypothetical protein